MMEETLLVRAVVLFSSTKGLRSHESSSIQVCETSKYRLTLQSGNLLPIKLKQGFSRRGHHGWDGTITRCGLDSSDMAWAGCWLGWLGWARAGV